MICVIPARKGSTRIPLKNIKEFKGKPIIEYSIETAQESGLFDKIIISTDGDEISDVIRKKYSIDMYGDFGSHWTVLPDHIKLHDRSPEFSKNDIGTQDVIKNVIKDLKISDDFVCCLYPCSPLLLPEDLAKAWAFLETNPNMLYAFSVGTEPLRDAGNFYFGRRSAYLGDIPVHGSYSVMIPLPEERVCDINTTEDWAEAERKYEALYG